MRQQIYTPGAGHMPPELAGREVLLSSWVTMLAEVSAHGRPRSQEVVLTGPRGVGKSVLLTRLSDLATAQGWSVIRLQGSRRSSMLARLSQQAAEHAESTKGAWAAARDTLHRITSLGVTIGGVGATISRAPATDPSGDYPEAIAAVLAHLGIGLRDAASAEVGGQARRGGLIISVDEVQMTRPEDIRLIGAVLNHLNTAHPAAAVVFVAAGLPNTQARMIGPDPDQPNITNPERLFRFHPLPPRLTPDEAAVALTRPAQRVGVTWDADAVRSVLDASELYPAHLQIYAAAAWQHGADTEPVSAAHAHAILNAAQDQVRQQYLEPRWRNLSPHHRAYLTALALCGGEATSGQVAAVLGTKTTAQSKRRDALINRGEIYDPEYGRVNLAMPAMAAFALERYPDTVANADDPLPTLQQMTDNLTQWHTTRNAAATSSSHDVIGRSRAAQPSLTTEGTADREA